MRGGAQPCAWAGIPFCGWQLAFSSTAWWAGVVFPLLAAGTGCLLVALVKSARVAHDSSWDLRRCRTCGTAAPEHVAICPRCNGTDFGVQQRPHVGSALRRWGTVFMALGSIAAALGAAAVLTF
ncbi:MAG: hypothetical protein HY332_20445 [Chloroflexi bacterium]|nr:hypothetical protein [Chloroflexota bacterium]